jgi:cysteinyl-tRNA synthetase
MAAASALERLDSLDRRLVERAASKQTDSASGGFSSKVNSAREGFFAALEDDFNTAAALGRLFTFVSETNLDLEAGRLSAGDATLARTLLATLAGDVLGVLPFERESDASPVELVDEAQIRARIAARQEARRRRDFKAADAIRDELAAKGILLEDTPGGVRWRRKP